MFAGSIFCSQPLSPQGWPGLAQAERFFARVCKHEDSRSLAAPQLWHIDDAVDCQCRR